MAYIFPWTEFQAARPVDAPHVRSSHLEDVQFKRLLEEDEVVVCHGEAVIVAGWEHWTAGERGDHLRTLQSRALLALAQGKTPKQ